MPVSYAAQWKMIKVDYEAATDRKKPSEKFLGLFKKASGLDSAFTTIDAALKKDDAVAAKKAFETVEKNADVYQKTLFKAAMAEKDKEIQKDTKLMMTKLNDLVEESDMAWKSAATVPRLKSLRDFAKLMKTPAADRVEAFAKKRHSEEALKFLVAMARKDYSVKVFKEFVKDNDINIPGTMLVQFKEDDLKNAPWDDAAVEVLRLFNDNILAGLNKEIR